MSEKITLYYKDINSESLTCLIALEQADFEVDFIQVDQKTLFGKDLKTINPVSLTPFAVYNNQAVLQAGSILRLAGKKNENLYGSDNLSKAKVDTFLDLLINFYGFKVNEVMDSIYDKTKTKIDFRKIETQIT